MPGLLRTTLVSAAAGFATCFHIASEVDSAGSSNMSLPLDEQELMSFDIQADGNLQKYVEEVTEEGQEDGADGLNATKTQVLLVDVRGPTGTTGDGVRTMGMLMDLKSKACRHRVEVLSDIGPDGLKSSWPDSVSCKKFAGVHVWTTKEFKNHRLNLNNFHRIIIGAKLELLYEDHRSGVAVPAVIRDLEGRHDIPRTHVAVYWDDVPFDRCLIKDDASVLCPKVAKAVTRLANIAHTFYVLSEDDKERMTRQMKKHGVWRENLVVNVWPMRIRNMWEMLPWERFNYNSYEKKDLVTMMGNHHAVNKQMVNHMFEQGIVGHICHQIKEHKSPVKLFFMGGLASFAQSAAEHQKGKTDMSCVVTKTGFISDSELRKSVIPRTRAVLNPFFFDVNSGISVKNFESVMMGVPFITHRWGMHGLADEFTPCSWYPMPKEPHNAEEFQNFFVRNIVRRTGYLRFAEKFHKISKQCAHSQTVKYPVENQCW